MEFFSKILNFVKESQSLYNEYQPYILTLKSIIEKKSKFVDCDVFTPSEEEILEEFKKTNPVAYSKIENDINEYEKNFPKESENIPVFKIEDFKEIVESSSKIDEPIKDSEIKKIIATEPPCDTETKKERKSNENLKTFDVEEYKKALEEIQNCVKNIDFEKINKKDNKYSKEELKKEIEDFCEEETPTEMPEGVLPSSNFGKLEPEISESDEDDYDIEDTDPKDILKELNSFLTEKQSKCNETIFEESEKLQTNIKKYNEINNKYREHERKKDFSYLPYTMYQIYYEAITKKNNKSLSVKYKDPKISISEFSKEISFVESKTKLPFEFSLFTIEINDSPKEGYYYDIEKKYSEIIKEKVKDNKSEEIIKLQDIIEKEKKDYLKNKLESYEKTLKSNSGYMLTELLKLGDVYTPKLKDLLKILRDEHKKIYDGYNKDYEDIKSERDSLKSYIENFQNNLNEKLKELDCFDLEEDVEEDPKDFENPNFKGLSEKPNMTNIKWWRRFCRLASTLSLLPIPLFTNSNDIRLGYNNYPSLEFEYPKGSIVLDDDGIPRFLFYPIGLIIPTPFSADLMYRIPIPPLILPLTVQRVTNPLNSLREEIGSKITDIINLDFIYKEYSKFYSTAEDIFNLPESALSSYMNVLNVRNPLTSILSNISSRKLEVNNELYSYVSELQSKINEGKEIAITEQEEIKRKIQSISSKYYGYVSKELNDLQRNVDELKKNLSVPGIDGIINNLNSIFSTIETIVSNIDKCTGSNFSKVGLKTGVNSEIDKLINEFGKFSDTLSLNSIPTFPFPEIPSFNINEYIPSFGNSNLELSSVLEGINSIIMNMVEVETTIQNYIDDATRRIFASLNIDVFKIPKNLKINKNLLETLPLLDIEFPEAIIVPCIVQTGIIPYPMVIVLNLGNVPLGPIKERAMSLITIDYKKPIKLVKKNPNSVILDIGTNFLNTINNTLGYSVDGWNTNDPNVKSSLYINSIDLCKLKERISSFDSFSDIFDIEGIKDSWKKLKNDITNLNPIPNPNYICSLLRGKNTKDSMEKILRDMNMSPNAPAAISNLSNFNIEDIKNGKILLEGSTLLFPLTDYLNVKDVLNIDTSVERDLNINELGISKKAVIDILPSIKRILPYIIDDLPPYERLSLSNIPFVLFLLQFCNEVRRGCKFPIPEITFIPD